MIQKPTSARLPHHKLVAYQRAMQLLVAVRLADIADSGLRDQANRAARGACLNIAEAVGRGSRADQNRVFAIARGEVVETAAAIEIAAACQQVALAAAEEIADLANQTYALLTGLIRR